MHDKVIYNSFSESAHPGSCLVSFLFIIECDCNAKPGVQNKLLGSSHLDGKGVAPRLPHLSSVRLPPSEARCS